MSWLLHLNYILFQDINNHAGTHPWLDQIMIFSADWLIFFFPLVMLLLWGIPNYWRRRPLQPEEAKLLQERRAVVLWIGIACLLSYGINLLIEQFVFEPRPFVSYHVHQLISHPADSAFPSDHLGWSFAVVGMLLFLLIPFTTTTWQRQKRGQDHIQWSKFVIPCGLFLLALLMGVLIGIARIFVGVHYPGDILGGAIDGLIAASLVTLLRQKLARPTYAVLRFATFLHLA